MIQKLEQRLIWPDVLKALAIFLVVLGHVSSQYDSRGYSSPIALWIYSFHMPLFMMLSGMFFKYSLRKDFKTMWIDKSRLLLLPLFCWGIVHLFIEELLFTDFSKWGGVIADYVKSGGPLRGYWYLKCLYLYLVVNYTLVKLTKRLLLAALISITLFVMLPNVNFSSMMIVFFWIGVYYEHIARMVKQKQMLLITALASIGCYLLLDIKATYLASSGSFIQYIQFLLIGTSASLFWMSLFERLMPPTTASYTIRLLQKIGTLSLGIYCIHEFFYFEKLYRPVFDALDADSAFVQMTYSAIVLVVSFTIVKWMSGHKYLALFFLGRKLISKS